MTALSWTPEAERDRDEIFDYIKADNPAAALALDERFAEGAQKLAEHPYMGHLGRVGGTRELVVHEHYLMVYDIADSTIRMLRILHTARRWPVNNGRG